MKNELHYLKTNINNNVIEVKYSSDIYGRLSADHGLNKLKRNIRHTLATDNYIDIDMENSMPNILLNVCIDNNIKCKYLKKYINNRQKYINEVQQFYNVTKDQAKEIFIMLTFNGSYLTWLKNICTTNR